MPGLLRGLHPLISDFFSWSLVYMALTPTLWHLPASLGSHMSAAVICVIAGEYEAEDKAKKGWEKLKRAPREFLKLSTQVWEGARSSEQWGLGWHRLAKLFYSTWDFS